MPIFEFVCDECETLFEELVFGSDIDDVVCESCGSEQVRKKMSTFSSKIAGGEASLSLGNSVPPSSCNIGGG